MTRAASELHLTQSGVSQHIKSLEDSLGRRLFDRDKHSIIATKAASVLFEACQRGLGELERAFWEISGGELNGIFSFGAPPEFAYNVLLPLIAGLQKKHPRLIPKLSIGYAANMNEKLLSGELDFAFVDDFSMDPRLRLEWIYDERIELVANAEVMKAHGRPRNTVDYYEKLPYIAYFESEPVLRNWFGHHLKRRDLKLNVRAYLSDCQSVSRMVVAGMGFGVLPDYQVKALEKAKTGIKRLPGSDVPLINKISLASLASRTQSIGVVATMNYFRETFGRKSVDK